MGLKGLDLVRGVSLRVFRETGLDVFVEIRFGWLSSGGIYRRVGCVRVMIMALNRYLVLLWAIVIDWEFSRFILSFPVGEGDEVAASNQHIWSRERSSQIITYSVSSPDWPLGPWLSVRFG